ncbi:hypothetical protein GIS00_23475 [Nakamurella sp. YIM 132087]|uniref:HTH luxR-type domain-containing protein n=1 Tax=Nakamurella alba TaxID=2665158 RepID=A0A7K1FU71_9ACTN|nr:LuxR C-terminal-related transcriptional regulator [Nakamurella alba]MTD16899.1 hypothetical protein [Nakamurella alba]
MNAPPWSGTTSSLIGRETLLARLAELPGSAAERSRVVRITGGPGSGRSAVLHALLRAARRSGAGVTAVGMPPGAGGPAAVIDALFAELGVVRPTGEVPAAVIARSLTVAIATAARTVLQVVAVDDADDLDPWSTGVLAEIEQQLPTRNVLMVLVARRSRQDREEYHLGPLDESRSAALLDALPGAPEGLLRRLVLEAAAGNPLALHEYVAALRSGSGDLPQLPAPTHRLIASYRRALDGVPDKDRDAVRERAALSDHPGPRGAEPQGAQDSVDPVVLELFSPANCMPSRAAGAAVLADMQPHEIRRLRRRLAERLADVDPAAAAWQSAMAGDLTDEVAARHLDTLALRLDIVDGIAALLGAAQVSAAPAQADRRRALAKEWAGQERPLAGGALVGPHPLDVLLTAVRRVLTHDDEAAGSALRAAAERLGAGPHVGIGPAPGGLDPAEAAFWAGAIADADRWRTEAESRVRERLEVPAADRAARRTDGLAGLAALVLDRTRDAIVLLGRGGAGRPEDDDPWADLCRRTLPWALFDAGRFADCLLPAGPHGLPVWSGEARIVRASVGALRGDRAADAALRTLASAIDPRREPVLAARIRRARAAFASVAGDQESAWRQLRPLVGKDRAGGRGAEALVLGDLAAAGRGAGHLEELVGIVAPGGGERHEPPGSGPSLRTRLVHHRARALIDPTPDAEHHFRLALLDPGGGQWPLERAHATADYAGWLRMRRRPREAREMYAAAHDAYTVMGLDAWAGRAADDGRAVGAPVSARQGDPRLTAQQRRVAELAASGWTNEQIAENLGLSVRTVSTHLSRAFVALGVGRRTQLAGALRTGEETGTGS